MKMYLAGSMIQSMTAQVPGYVEVWWDPGQKLWTIQLKDREDNQIGDADHAAHKHVAVTRAHGLCKQYGYTVLIRTRKEG